jgi:drug/metabolite transporter (DMT)-like permease
LKDVGEVRVVMNVSEQQKREWKEKASDYKTFGGILLALSVFLYIGMLIPEKQSAISMGMQSYLIIFVMILLAGSYYFFKKSVKYIRLLHESEAEK